MLRDEGVVEDDLDRPGAGEGGQDRAERAHEREDELAADPLDVGLEVVKQADETSPADVLKERVLLQGHSGLLGSVGGGWRSWPGPGRCSRCGRRSWACCPGDGGAPHGGAGGSPSPGRSRSST